MSCTCIILFTCENTRVMQLLMNLFVSKLSKYQCHHKHNHKSLETYLLNTTLLCTVHTYVRSSIKDNYYFTISYRHFFLIQMPQMQQTKQHTPFKICIRKTTLSMCLVQFLIRAYFSIRAYFPLTYNKPLCQDPICVGYCDCI